jgi:hypothetical protein
MLPGDYESPRVATFQNRKQYANAPSPGFMTVGSSTPPLRPANSERRTNPLQLPNRLVAQTLKMLKRGTLPQE